MIFNNDRIIYTVLVFCMAMTVHAQFFTINHDGLERSYLLHLPPEYDEESSIPLVIAMHGGFGSALNLQNQSRLSIKADEENFIVVYPEGVKGGLLQIRTWNAGWCCGYAVDNDIDDVGFIDKMIDDIIHNYNIDETKVFATGMSNGGFMAYRLACELSDKIAAIAPVACSMGIDDCDPQQTVPVIHFHSYLDENIPYLGGIGAGFSSHHNAPQDSVIGAWRILNNCEGNIDTIAHNEMFTFTKSINCDCGSEIHHYITQDGGHSWPGGQKTSVGDPPSEFINANDLMWSFFEQVDCMVSVEKENINIEIPIKIFPSPSEGVLNFIGLEESDIITLTDRNGVFYTPISITNRQFDYSNVPSGLYFCTILSGTQKIVKKIIIAHK